LINQYPWTKFGENATVIDLGCGPGTTAMSIVRVHNKLNWVMVDLPFMVPEIRKVFCAQISLTESYGNVSGPPSSNLAKSELKDMTISKKTPSGEISTFAEVSSENTMTKKP
jgi:hypothetical protein